ncbi:hypothetical protein ACFLT1_01410 [Bacteroidota bacterium]
MNKNIFLTIGLLFALAALYGQENSFQPGGKSVLRIFSNYNTSFSDGERGSAFELQRVYLGYDHKFSEYLSGAAVLDVGDPGVGKLQMTAYVKNAYLRYKKNDLTVNFGMISTTQFKVQESAWGYRYLAKSFQDEYKFNSSADIGVSVAYQIADFVSADVIIANGEGYKKIESDSTLRTGFGISLTPFENFTARAYYDFSTDVNTQSSIATFLGYATGRFNIGAEYIMQLQPDFAANRQWNGLSFYSTVNLMDQLKVFGRFDQLSSNTVAGEAANWNLSGDGQWYIAGIEFSPVKGIKLAPNFKGWNPSDNSLAFVSTFILNIEVKF